MKGDAQMKRVVTAGTHKQAVKEVCLWYGIKKSDVLNSRPVNVCGER